MLMQHRRCANFAYPFHQPGEVVLAAYGNFLEAGERCQRKLRPVILLRTSLTQHMFAGLTTKPTYQTTGEPRPVLPKAPCLGLDHKTSHLWSARPAFVCRLDIHKHLGWIDHVVVSFLAEHVDIDPITLGLLYRAATLHGHNHPRQPR
jgi:hypothetical protein